MSEGWVKLHREITDHPLFVGRMDRLGAFVWLIKEAAFKPRRVDINGRIVTLERGQLSHSIAFIAKAWGWSKSTTERFLTRLKTETMIGTASGTGRTVITICNYDKYQGDDRYTGTASGTASGTAAGRQRDKLEEGKKERKKEDTPSTVSDTETLTDKTIPTHRGANVKNSNGKKYAWQGETFRLTVKDWRAWRRRYWALADLRAYLERIDEWYINKPERKKRDMMFAYSGWLAKEHDDLVRRGAKKPQWLIEEERANAQ